jgi:hypothetical protein
MSKTEICGIFLPQIWSQWTYVELKPFPKAYIISTRTKPCRRMYCQILNSWIHISILNQRRPIKLSLSNVHPTDSLMPAESQGVNHIDLDFHEVTLRFLLFLLPITPKKSRQIKYKDYFTPCTFYTSKNLKMRDRKECSVIGCGPICWVGFRIWSANIFVSDRPALDSG